MSTNKQALRSAAEKATRGIWRYLKTTPFMDAEISAENNTRVVNLLSGDVTEANSEFIAAANPATVLALLDELEAKEEQRANWFQMAEKLGAGLDAAERRIAELEARTVVIPDDLDFDCEFENGDYGIEDELWLRGRIDGFNTGMKKITKAIRATGITVKGDSE